MFDNIKGLPRAFAVQLMRIGGRWTPHSRRASRGRLLSVGYRGKSPTPWEWKEEHNSGIQECENNGWRKERHDGKGLLNVAVAQDEATVKPDPVTDDFTGKAVVLVVRGVGRRGHAWDLFLGSFDP